MRLKHWTRCIFSSSKNSFNLVFFHFCLFPGLFSSCLCTPVRNIYRVKINHFVPTCFCLPCIRLVDLKLACLAATILKNVLLFFFCKSNKPQHKQPANVNTGHFNYHLVNWVKNDTLWKWRSGSHLKEAEWHIKVKLDFPLTCTYYVYQQETEAVVINNIDLMCVVATYPRIRHKNT